jgi:hypothetical protein
LRPGRSVVPAQLPTTEATPEPRTWRATPLATPPTADTTSPTPNAAPPCSATAAVATLWSVASTTAVGDPVAFA